MKTKLGNVLICVGVLIALLPLATWAYGEYWQQRMASQFEKELASQTLSPTTATLAVPVRTATMAPPKARRMPVKKAVKKPARKMPKLRVGEPLARLRIPRIGLQAIVVEGVGRVSLRRGPGHLPNTGLPGESRNCALAAHRDAWFEELPQLRIGDVVWCETPTAVYKYTARRTAVVTPDRGDLLNQGPKPMLTLITCTGPGYPNSQYRLLVFCDLTATYPR